MSRTALPLLLMLCLASCDVFMHIENRAPVAVVGLDIYTTVGATVILDGSASYDLDGDALSYSWSLLSASGTPSLVDADQVRATLTPDEVGFILAGLVVSDGKQYSDTAVLRVTVVSDCEQDSDCDDHDDCTEDHCRDHICVFEAIPDCEDLCPEDPDKTEPGVCGCGVPDTDSDSDGTPDCNDLCPDDPNKIEPGDCGCGQPESSDDTDGDGEPDCTDLCYLDPNKTEPGICGCGVPEDTSDSDSDGTPDCIDGCPSDPNKIDPGDCGCGMPETDSDSDGTPDCIDGCPDDP
ncbi:MAG: hypothetical protein JXR96_24340, partial [Deltaproteobacteria bacterium]|nr:hypothetical protein [Deltaproteobacteria bacterium]